MGKNIVTQRDLIEKYQVLLKECFQEHVKTYAKDSQGEGNLRTLYTELYAAIKIEKATKLYLQFFEIIDNELKELTSAHLLDRALHLESALLTGVLINLKENIQFAYSALRFYCMHVISSQVSNEEQNLLLLRWIPPQIDTLNRAKFLSLLAVILCETAVTAERLKVPVLAEKAILIIKSYIQGIEPDCIVQVLTFAIALAFVFKLKKGDETEKKAVENLFPLILSKNIHLSSLGEIMNLEQNREIY